MQLLSNHRNSEVKGLGIRIIHASISVFQIKTQYCVFVVFNVNKNHKLKNEKSQFVQFVILVMLKVFFITKLKWF